MSTLAFDVVQFFPSLNYCLISLILDKAGFNPRISSFFSDYLVSRKTQYLWNNFLSPFFNVDFGVGQGSALFPILLALYLSPLFHIFEKQAKNLKIPISFLSFVDNSLFISQEKSFEKTNSVLFCSYNIVSSLFNQFSLIIEHRKTKVFHFSRLHEVFNLPSLDLSCLGGSFPYPKDTWHYLGFIFDRKLSFHQYVKFYTNKALSTVKYMKMLGNSTHGLLLYQKQLLYKKCVLSIALYRFFLWHYNNTPLSYLLNELNKM